MEQCRRRRPQPGFTLVELLVVMVILGLLVGIAAPVAINYVSKAKSDVARIQIQTITASLDLFRLDLGRYPSSEEGLAALVRAPVGLANWKGPYIEGKGPPSDPWDRPYIYQRASQSSSAYALGSLGADGVEGGEGADADITVP